MEKIQAIVNALSDELDFDIKTIYSFFAFIISTTILILLGILMFVFDSFAMGISCVVVGIISIGFLAYLIYSVVMYEKNI